MSSTYYQRLMTPVSQNAQTQDLNNSRMGKKASLAIKNIEDASTQFEKTMTSTKNKNETQAKTYLNMSFNFGQEPKTTKSNQLSQQSAFYDPHQQFTPHNLNLQQYFSKRVHTAGVGDQKYNYILKQYEQQQKQNLAKDIPTRVTTAFDPSKIKHVRSKSTRDQIRMNMRRQSQEIARSNASRSRPITQNTRLYSRENKALSKIEQSNSKLDRKLDIMSTQNLNLKDEYKQQVKDIIQNLDFAYSNLDFYDSVDQNTLVVDHVTLVDENGTIVDNKDAQVQRNPQQEYKQTSISNTIDVNEVSRKMNKTQLVCLENPFNRIKVKESDYPLDILYNKQVNALKKNERMYQMQSRPLNFSLWKNYEGNDGNDMSRYHLGSNGFILEHLFKNSKNDLKATRENEISPNIDVGKPLSLNIKGISPQKVNRLSKGANSKSPDQTDKPKTFSPTSFSGYYTQGINIDSDNNKLAAYAHNLNMMENFPDQVKLMTEKQQAQDMVKFQKRVTMMLAKQAQQKNPSTTSTFKSKSNRQSPQQMTEESSRYAKLLDDCMKFAKTKGEETSKQRKKQQSISYFDTHQEKYKLHIVKPDVSYLLSKKNEDDRILSDQISGLKVKDDTALERVMSRQYYGKWYVNPAEWKKLQNKGFKEQHIKLQRNQPRTQQSSPVKQAGGEVQNKQIDWNQQHKHEVKRSIFYKEFALTKLIEKMKVAKKQSNPLSNQKTLIKKKHDEEQQSMAKQLSIDRKASITARQDRFQVAEEFIKDIQRILEGVGRQDDSTINPTLQSPSKTQQL